MKNVKVFLYTGIVIIVSVLACLVIWIMPGTKTMSVLEYKGFTRDQVHIVFEDDILDEHMPVINNGDIYIPLSFIKAFVDEYIFWESDYNLLTITDELRTIRLESGEYSYTLNQDELPLEKAVMLMGNMPYIEAQLCLEIYSDMQFSFDRTYNFLKADIKDHARADAINTKERSAIRVAADKKSYILERIPKGARLRIFEQQNEYTRVRLDNGLVGFISTDNIAEIVSTEGRSNETYTPTDNESITLVWDQVFNEEANRNESRLDIAEAVDVVVFTWFSFDEEDTQGDIVSIADRELVTKIKSKGKKVWALIDDNFDNRINHNILTNPYIREHVIYQLKNLVHEYDLDGINVDFEAFTEAEADHYLQFLRELRVALPDSVLSAALYVPLYTKYLNRKGIAQVLDYIAVMAYDEHYSGSDAGPVASLPFVRQGIEDTLEEVPKEKILLGIPVYNRIWRDGKFHSNVGMQTAEDILIDNETDLVWIPDLGYNYGSYILDDGSYEIWLEDTHSVLEKIKLMKEYELRGLAIWKKSLASDEFWGILE